MLEGSIMESVDSESKIDDSRVRSGSTGTKTNNVIKE